MKKIELLAPAGSMEALYAAVCAGADAVYIGGTKFSARASAANFTDEEIIEAVKYCHLYGVKVYVTINTLIKEKELKDAVAYGKFLYNAKVDALLVQDMGLFSLLKEEIPEVEIHASTQMTVHNGQGAKFLIDKGFKRIVLSRELNLQEITHISKDLNIETEIFTHGALCISYSGQCLMSSLIGGRSGNRGRCAQPCRKRYSLVGENVKAYLLSTKDICTLNNIEDIINTGTSSLKIEGRMKKSTYVAGVTSIYRGAIDSIYEGKSYDFHNNYKKLLQLFNREGFSKGYIFNGKGRELMAENFPKNTGIYLGKVEKCDIITLEEDLSVGDGIRFNQKGCNVSSIIKDDKKITDAKAHDKVKIIPKAYNTFDKLYKTLDVKLEKEMEDIYKDPFSKKIKLEVGVHFLLNKNIELTTFYNGRKIEVTGDLIEKAKIKPLSKEKIEENMKKTGGTPFEIKVSFESFEDGFLSAASINKVRRELIDEVMKTPHENKGNVNSILPSSKKKLSPIIKDLICVTKKEQLKAAIDCGYSNICIDSYLNISDINYEDIKNNSLLNLYLKVPTIIRGEFNLIVKEINEVKPYIKGIVTSNLGIINVFKDLKVILDYKSNILNSHAMDYYEAEGCYLSLELSKEEIKNLGKKYKESCGMLLYGEMEAMIMEHCILESSLNKSKGNCTFNCKNRSFYLEDEIGEKFKIITDKFHRNHIYNSKKLNLLNNITEIEDMGIINFRLDFYEENYEETSHVLNSYKNKILYDSEGYTKGHYKRGVK